MKELKQYPITRHGLDLLSKDDQVLLDRARTIVMWSLENKYGKSTEKSEIAMKEASQWAGFHLAPNGIILNRPKKFYNDLYKKFTIAIQTLPINENDEMGIVDETLEIANIMLKYKYIIALKRKKKGLVEIVKDFFSSVV